MKERLDVLLVKRNLASSREKAKAIIMSGNVFVDGQREELPFRKRFRSKSVDMHFRMSAAEDSSWKRQ